MVTKIVIVPGMRVTKKKLSGSLQAREATMTAAVIVIKAKPIVVKRLAHLLWIKIKTDDKEKGTRSIPTAMTTAI
jgi:hypothetical protein